jgi:hypothetical protein
MISVKDIVAAVMQWRDGNLEGRAILSTARAIAKERRA